MEEYVHKSSMGAGSWLAPLLYLALRVRLSVLYFEFFIVINNDIFKNMSYLFCCTLNWYRPVEVSLHLLLMLLT